MGPHPEDGRGPDPAALEALTEVVTDDQLRLFFLCCHPALAPDAQVALTLRLLGGLDTPDIARAFLVPDATMAQRLVRAKRKLRANHAAYRIPADAELPDRVPTVLAAVYLIFNAGHSAPTGAELVRTDLAAEAIRLGRTVAELMPDEPEVLGLLALMLLTDARRAARVAPNGSFVRLSEQDRNLWNRDLIAEGQRLVEACVRRNAPGPFQLQATIAAVHAHATTASATNWNQIVSLYDQLFALRPNAVVAINRAVAIGERDGPAEGLAALGDIDAKAMADYQPFHAARADLLARLGRGDEAIAAYQRAIELSGNDVERAFLVRQAETARGR